MYVFLHPDFMQSVEGLCGDYNGDALNDFTTTGNVIAANSQEFGNLWAVSGACPQISAGSNYTIHPCEVNRILFQIYKFILMVYVFIRSLMFLCNLLLSVYDIQIIAEWHKKTP